MMGSPELPQDDQNDFNASAVGAVTVDTMDNGSEASDDSDTENEPMDYAYAGYQPLAGDDELNAVPMDDGDDDQMEEQQPQVRQPPLPEIANRITELEGNVWNAPRPETSTIELDSTRTAQILSAMSQISIPTEFTPVWARDVSEEKWKEDLLQRIRSRQSNSTTSPDDQ